MYVFRKKLLLITICLYFLIGCGGGGGVNVSIIPRLDDFNETPVVTNPKIDILWVIDPSRSMFTEIQAVQNNIDQFVSSFLDKKLDFRMGVITTAAWSSLAEGLPGKSFLGNNPFKSLHKGECIGNVAGADFVTDISAPNPTAFKNLFKPYIDVYGLALSTVACGLEGPPFASPPNDFPSIDSSNGYSANNIFSDALGRSKTERGQFLPYVNDERPLQSMQAFMNPSALSGGANQFSNLSSQTGAASFFRDEAFLAVIFVTDEVDASRDSLEPDSSAPAEHTSAQYLNYLDELKTSRNNYSIFSIIDTNVTNNLLSEIAIATGSTPIDINSNFASDLSAISTNIIADASFFPISCEAIPNSIEISYELNGVNVIIPKAPVGFTYNESRQGVSFAPDHVPPGGASISVIFQPTSLACDPGSGTVNVRPLALSNNTISESSSIGQEVGTVSVVNEDEGLSYSFSINPSSSEFSINSQTGVIQTTATFDYEVLNTYRITVVANNGTTDVSEDFVIGITDVSDSAAVAVTDVFSASESQVSSGQSFRDNLSDNDTGLDQVDSHVYTISDTANCSGVGLVSGANPSDVLLTILDESSGRFDFTVTGNLSVAVGSSQLVRYRYGVKDPGTGLCSTAFLDLNISGENQAPVIALDNLNQLNPLSLIDSSGSVGVISTTTLATSKIVDLASGTSLQTSGTPLDSTATVSGFHAIDIELSPVSSTTLFEVSQFQVSGPSGYDFGNSVMQIILDDGSTQRVLTREVLPVDQGNSVNIDFTDVVLGNKARFIRPTQSVNSLNDQDISVNSIGMTARPVDVSCVNVMDHVSDDDVPDLPDPLGTDQLEFFIADKLAEGSAPSWAFISNNATPADFRDDKVCVRPPNGTDIELSLVARDLSGAILTQVFKVVRDDGGAPTINTSPIALFQASDEKRGGISYKRYGGRNGGNQTSPFMDYVFAESGATCSIGAGNSDVDHTELDEFLISNLFPDLALSADDDSAVGFSGEFYDGWDTQCYTVYEPKFSQGGACNASSTPGVLKPCIINGTNVYGETYTGYFAPTKTGIYRFRSSSVDNAVRLLIAPSEYESDLLPVITGSLKNSTVRQVAGTTDTGVDPSSNWGCSGSELNSMISGSGSAFSFYDFSIYGSTPGCGSEFFPGNFGGGHSTSSFYSDIDNPNSSAFQPDYVQANDYKDGWVFLKQGNLYAMQIRFAEGGGGKSFLFSFDYKELGAPTFSNNWRDLDAVSLIPIEGAEAYTAITVPVTGGEVSFFASQLFYDVEFDVLEYNARLVNPDGTTNSSSLSDIGLVLNSVTGLLNGTISNPQNLRVVLSAKDPSGSDTSVEYLPLKFE